MEYASNKASLAQEKRLQIALRRLDSVVDGLGCSIDQGIAPVVAMLVEFSVNTSQSCEGHVGWATGGPYVDVSAKGYRAMRVAYDKALGAGSCSEEKIKAMREEIELMNDTESKKLIPLLTAFYAGRSVDYAKSIAMRRYGMGIMRLESVGVLYQKYEANLDLKNESLASYQDEMGDFARFLVQYEPKGPAALRQEKSGSKPSKP